MSDQILPAFARTALLLDMDGTLIDIAPRPDLVVVPPGLLQTLHTLRTELGGALAVISGRPVEQVDLLLDQAPHAVAGEHGGAVRPAPDAPIERPSLPTPPTEWLAAAERLAEAHRGVLLEHKARGFVLHYRAVPELGPALRDRLEQMLAGTVDFALLAAHMAWEVRPRGTDKGTAVAALMRRAPLQGRIPLFIGDDVTDEDAIVQARAMGGAGLRVDAAFGTAGDVRAWLAQAASRKAWPALPLTTSQPGPDHPAA
jgi:trehalose 6-phosphate phosphatase